MKILDCTLRDGGYYTNWDFDSDVVEAYVSAMNSLPIDYLEVGYRNNPSKEYLGKFGYSPITVLRKIRAKSKKKIAIMLNEKSTIPEDLDLLVKPIVGLVDMVRIAVDPKNFDRAVKLAKAVKSYGFEVAFNMMYMSKWSGDAKFLVKLSMLDGIVDLFCMVDSFGGVTPNEVKSTLTKIKKNTSVAVGFHGHNNLQLGLINSVVAKEAGADFIDVTITGMGRGAGNLNTELLLTYFNKHNGLAVDFNMLGDVVSTFTQLQDKHGWGTNLPYMISGANGIPQKDVMNWVANRVYSFNSIIRALDNRRNRTVDNARFPIFNFNKKYSEVIVIGGGLNAVAHKDAIHEYLQTHVDAAVVFATARYAAEYQDIPNDCYYCLVGNEGRRLMRTVGSSAAKSICVLPPYPREMGTEVPECVKNVTFELSKIDFTATYRDSVTAIALQLSMELTAGEVFLVGYDGYPGNILSEKEMSLTRENSKIFTAFRAKRGAPIKSLTPSLYSDICVVSVYQYL